EEALYHLQQVAKADDNIYAALMDTVQVARLGQITNALYEVGGKYRSNMYRFKRKTVWGGSKLSSVISTVFFVNVNNGIYYFHFLVLLFTFVTYYFLITYLFTDFYPNFINFKKTFHVA